ncbi:MAG: hypothetical protein K2N73_10510 [Lachnospiraceae bacterium]|nr:hypothetical protein [Lachnospiraceae bacterium]
MGIGYVDSVVVYNRYVNGLMETEQYFGTRFDNVRIELTQGANQKASGMENASACKVCIPNDKNLPKPYKAPKKWEKLTTAEMLNYFTLDEKEDFFVIVKKEELGIDENIPVGLVESSEYEGGYFEFCKGEYGYTFSVDEVDSYKNVAGYGARWEINGR